MTLLDAERLSELNPGVPLQGIGGDLRSILVVHYILHFILHFDAAVSPLGLVYVALSSWSNDAVLMQ